MKARTIAESATTSILLQQNLVQQQELLESKKQLAEMKAALYMACTTLEQTNYMESNVSVLLALVLGCARRLSVYGPGAAQGRTAQTVGCWEEQFRIKCAHRPSSCKMAQLVYVCGSPEQDPHICAAEEWVC